MEVLKQNVVKNYWILKHHVPTLNFKKAYLNKEVQELF